MFHRRVTRLLFLAQRVAPDILLSVNVFAGVVKAPTVQDWERLDRVFRYLNLVYKAGGKLEPAVYIDASFACHEDMRSRTGAVLYVANCFVGAWTTKQSLNTKSSTEAELVGLTDECTWLIWARNWLEAMGYKQTAAVVFQDNDSVKDILKRGPSA